MTPSDQSVISSFAVKLSPASHERLGEIADEAGITRSRAAALLLEELIPTIAGIKTRLQVTRRPGRQSE